MKHYFSEQWRLITPLYSGGKKNVPCKKTTVNQEPNLHKKCPYAFGDIPLILKKSTKSDCPCND